MKIKFYNPNNDIIPLDLHIIIDDKYHITYKKDPEMRSKYHPAYIFDLKLSHELKFNNIKAIMEEVGQQIIRQSQKIEEDWDLESFEILTLDKISCKFKLTFKRD